MMEDTYNVATSVELLTQPTTVGQIGSKSKCESESTPKMCSTRPTIFDISEGDRYRIFKLIEELLDAQDDADKLRQKLQEERTDFREKRSALVKKLDNLSEKHEKSLSDIQLLKERYASNLKSLEDKISTVSDKLETSAMEIKELKKVNEELLKENTMLRNLHKESEAVIASCQDENSKISLLLDVQREKEKGYKKQLKKAMSTEYKADYRPPEEKFRFGSSSASTTEEIVLYKNSACKNHIMEPVDQRSGAGDFIAEKIANKSASSFETIKAPRIVICDKRVDSDLHVTGKDTRKEPDVPPTSIQNFSFDRDQPREFEETILLESLFFRF